MNYRVALPSRYSRTPETQQTGRGAKTTDIQPAPKLVLRGVPLIFSNHQRIPKNEESVGAAENPYETFHFEALQRHRRSKTAEVLK